MCSREPHTPVQWKAADRYRLGRNILQCEPFVLAFETLVMQWLLAYGFRDESIVHLKRHDLNIEEFLLGPCNAICMRWRTKKPWILGYYLRGRLLYAHSSVVTFIWWWVLLTYGVGMHISFLYRCFLTWSFKREKVSWYSGFTMHGVLYLFTTCGQLE